MPKLRAVLHVREKSLQIALAKIRVIKPGEYHVNDIVDVFSDGRWLTGFRVKAVSESMVEIITGSKGKFEGPIGDFRHSLKEIKNVMARNRGDQITLFPSYSVFVSLVQENVQLWRPALDTLFMGYYDSLWSLIVMILEEPPKIQSLNELLSMKLAELIDKASGKVQNVLESYFQREMRPHTSNHYLFSNIADLRYGPMIKAINSLGPSTTPAAVISLIQKVWLRLQG